MHPRFWSQAKGHQPLTLKAVFWEPKNYERKRQTEVRNNGIGPAIPKMAASPPRREIQVNLDVVMTD